MKRYKVKLNLNFIMVTNWNTFCSSYFSKHIIVFR